MPKAARITGTDVTGPTGVKLGAVEHVLFHPSEPRVVGYEVLPVLLWKMVPRKTRFLSMTDTTIDSDGYGITSKTRKIPPPAVTARELGIDWDETVIWRDMPVRTESGKDLGRVGDVVFSDGDGRVSRVILSEGTTHDVAVGKTRLTADLLVGFDGSAVVVRDAALTRETSGGIATVAGAGSAVAKDTLGRAATAAARTGGKFAAKAANRMKKAAKEWSKYLGEDE